MIVSFDSIQPIVTSHLPIQSQWTPTSRQAYQKTFPCQSIYSALLLHHHIKFDCEPLSLQHSTHLWSQLHEYWILCPHTFALTRTYELEWSSVAHAGEIFYIYKELFCEVAWNESKYPRAFTRLVPSRESFLSALKSPHNITAQGVTFISIPRTNFTKMQSPCRVRLPASHPFFIHIVLWITVLRLKWSELPIHKDWKWNFGFLNWITSPWLQYFDSAHSFGAIRAILLRERICSGHITAEDRN
jgi:hypothetical protein